MALSTSWMQLKAGDKRPLYDADEDLVRVITRVEVGGLQHHYTLVINYTDGDVTSVTYYRGIWDVLTISTHCFTSSSN